jgi:hypothetical protein
MAPPLPDSQMLLKTLNAGIEQWRKDVSFRSSYRMRSGFSKSIEAGLQDGVDVTISGSPGEDCESFGQFHKMGKLQRYSQIFPGGKISVSDPSNKPTGRGEHPGKEPKAIVHAYVNCSKDEVFNDRFLIRYYPGDAGDCAAVDPFDNSWAKLGGLPSHSMNPLNPFGNPRELRYLELHDFESPKDPKSFSVELHPLDKDHLDVILRREGTWKQYRKIGVWTGATPPVVTAIDEVQTDPKGKVFESHHRFSDFKRCPGGMVARHVRAVFSGGDGKVRVQEWRSPDLGNVQPTKNDFVVILTPRTSISNLKDPPTSDAQPRALDVTRLTDADLGMPIRPR